MLARQIQFLRWVLFFEIFLSGKTLHYWCSAVELRSAFTRIFFVLLATKKNLAAVRSSYPRLQKFRSRSHQWTLVPVESSFHDGYKTCYFSVVSFVWLISKVFSCHFAINFSTLFQVKQEKPHLSKWLFAQSLSWARSHSQKCRRRCLW